MVIDDDDLAALAPLLERTLGAFAAVEPPGRRQPLEHVPAMHPGPPALLSCRCVGGRSVVDLFLWLG
jgi:hypothetical protein